jgi:hypothetical protein
MSAHNYRQKHWQQDVAASDLNVPKFVDVAIQYEEVLETARKIAAQSRERIRTIAWEDPTNMLPIDEIRDSK